MHRPSTNLDDKEKVQKVLVAYLRGIKPDAIPDSSNIPEIKIHRILDSLDMLALIAQLETAFAIQIRDEDVLAQHFETIGSLTAFVSRRLSRRVET